MMGRMRWKGEGSPTDASLATEVEISQQISSEAAILCLSKGPLAASAARTVESALQQRAWSSLLTCTDLQRSSRRNGRRYKLFRRA